MIARYAVLYAIPVLGYPALMYWTASWPPSATARGMLGWVSIWTGQGVAVALVGSLGLLYKPNRYGGLVAGLLLSAILMFMGRGSE